MRKNGGLLGVLRRIVWLIIVATTGVFVFSAMGISWILIGRIPKFLSNYMDFVDKIGGMDYGL